MFKFLKISCDFTAIQEILQIRNNSMRTQLGVTAPFSYIWRAPDTIFLIVFKYLMYNLSTNYF